LPSHLDNVCLSRHVACFESVQEAPLDLVAEDRDREEFDPPFPWQWTMPVPINTNITHVRHDNLDLRTLISLRLPEKDRDVDSQ
jgi:hypothetical protein